jgi:hypothetical protein
LPEGVKLQIRAGSVYLINLDPKEPNVGTHHFFGAGSYRLTIAPGAKMELPIVFDLPAEAGNLRLTVGACSPVSVHVREQK